MPKKVVNKIKKKDEQFMKCPHCGENLKVKNYDDHFLEKHKDVARKKAMKKAQEKVPEWKKLLDAEKKPYILLLPFLSKETGSVEYNIHSSNTDLYWIIKNVEIFAKKIEKKLIG